MPLRKPVSHVLGSQRAVLTSGGSRAGTHRRGGQGLSQQHRRNATARLPSRVLVEMEWEGARPFLPGAREGDGVTLSPAPVNAWREHRALTAPPLLADRGRRNAHHQLRFGLLPGRVAPAGPGPPSAEGPGTRTVFS